MNSQTTAGDDGTAQPEDDERAQERLNDAWHTANCLSCAKPARAIDPATVLARFIQTSCQS